MTLFFKKLYSRLYAEKENIRIYALVGKSGTGKSFRAKMVAQTYKIDLIIDDGLIIRGEKIIAGHSAKQEKTFLSAVKVAIFDEKRHCSEAVKVLRRYVSKKILILGTSEKMVHKIALKLKLPLPQKIIKIEDIATKEELATAKRCRELEGKHVIPVPSNVIKRNYPKIFYKTIRLLFKKPKILPIAEQETLFEKSVVRPSFSKVETVKITRTALKQLLFHTVVLFEPSLVIKNLAITEKAHGYDIVLTLDIPFTTELTAKIHQLQGFLVNSIEQESGVLIEDVHVVIDKVIDST